MKATPSLSSVVFLVLALCLCQSLIADSVFNKFRVHLINGFKNSTLEAHCKSEKGNDLGHQHIPVHQQFSWKFYTGLFDRFWIPLKRAVPVFALSGPGGFVVTSAVGDPDRGSSLLCAAACGLGSCVQLREAV
ncbi:hypothetical protein ACOSP7_003471 [Xanthoceras sorbifolium]